MPEHKFNLDEMMQSPEATDLVKNKQKLMQLVNSPDAKKLIELLSQNNGNDLQNAAHSAIKGDTTALMSMMQQIMQRPDGAKAVEGLSKKIPQK